MTETTASALPAYSGPCDCGRGMAHRLNPDVMSDSHDRWCATRAVPSDARWESLKAYLRDRIDAETPVMEGFRGEITGAASGGMVSACRSALAEMKRLEQQR